MVISKRLFNKKHDMKKLFYLLLFPLSSFAQVTDSNLNLEADTIRLETHAGRNTAQRVGRMFKNIIASKSNINGNTGILAIAGGGTGTASPGLVAGTNISITGSWPNQTINQSGGSGISNSAPSNDLMKSNGVNAVASGVSIPAGGGMVSTVSNSAVLQGSGNTTSNTLSDILIYRTGSASFTAGQGAGINFNNLTSTKAVLLQGADDNLQFFRYNGSSWKESLRIDANGIIKNSTSSLAVADASIGSLKMYFSTSDNSVFHIGGFFEAEQTVSGTNSVQGVEGYTKVSHSSGSITLAIGTIGNIELASTGTLAIARSLQAGGNTSLAGTITEWDGVYVNFANSASAAITSAYGLYVDTFPSGVTNKWGIFIADSSVKNKIRGGMSMPDLPTSSAGLSSGDFWVNGNVVTRVP